MAGGARVRECEGRNALAPCKFMASSTNQTGKVFFSGDDVNVVLLVPSSGY